MTRRRGWVPDGRAKAIRADCEASLEALDGLADRPLPHPRARSANAVADVGARARAARGRGARAARRRREREPPRSWTRRSSSRRVAAVQVALSVVDDRAIRGGVVERCEERGIALIAHSPLGGPRRAGGLARHAELARSPRSTARRRPRSRWRGCSRSRRRSSPIPGARRPETARSAARAAGLELDRATTGDARRRSAGAVRRADAERRGDGEVVLVMGIPGAGKSRIAEEYVARGYLRLNRDERGGSLRELADALDEALSPGAARVVLDNTYLTRASRSYVIESGDRHGIRPRCVWLDTPLAQAQVNLVERLLDRFGSLPTPEELRVGPAEQGMLAPTSQMRAVRELEPPSADEGFAAVERVAVRARRALRARAGRLRRGRRAGAAGWEGALDDGDRALRTSSSTGGRTARGAADVARLAARSRARWRRRVCPHGGGPPTLLVPAAAPGLAARLRPEARRRPSALDPGRHGTAHRTLADDARRPLRPASARMTLLADVVAASGEVAATSSRSRKIAILAELLARLEPPRCRSRSASSRACRGRAVSASATRRSTASSARRRPSRPSRSASSTVRSPGSRRRRGAGRRPGARRSSTTLLGRATEPEADFIRRLFTGELRQGALAGLMVDAVAKAAGVPADSRAAR